MSSSPQRGNAASSRSGRPWPRGLLLVLRSDRWLLVSAVAVLAVAMLPTMLMLQVTDARQSDRELQRYGSTIAARLAAEALDPLIAGDRVSLNATTQEYTRIEGVAASAIYGADDELLAASDQARSSPRALNRTTGRGVFVHQVTLQEAIAGYVRIELAPAAFAAAGRTQLWLTTLVAIAASLALAAWLGHRLRQTLEPLAAALDGAEADPLARSEIARMYDTLLPAPAAAAPSAASEALQGDSHRPLYLLVLNLYNPVSLSAAERAEVLALCETLMEQVCRLYAGRTEALPGTGLLAILDADPRHEDHAFQALCVGLLTRRLLQYVNYDRARHGEVELAFRIAVDTATPATAMQFEAAAADLFPDAVERVVRLSAAAREDRVAVSGAVLEACANRDRLVAEPLDHSILRALGEDGDSAAPGACLLEDLASGYRELLDRQARLLLGQLDDSSRTDEIS